VAGLTRGFGVAAGLDPAVAEPLAARCAMLGYASMWSNDHPEGSGLETIAAFASAVPGIELGVAVLPLDRHSPESIGAKVAELGLTPERLWVGVGAGFAERPLTRMREALPQLRDALPGIRLVLAAMGPKMCELAGSSYDGAFLNWITPEFATRARERVQAGARGAGRRAPAVFGYVRTAVGPDAEERLRKEESFYRDLHDGYRNHFARLGEPEGKVGVATESPHAAQSELAGYEALDVVVVRGLASATIEAMSSLAEAVAPGGTEARAS
jgi:alkanesulfonate monooxygenase SsuD/methylene tetrahydromethanopterin reductase-like flavin-dependent oxidoreductase (luciferase family)